VPAWKQLVELGRRLGADWKYGTAAEVMGEIAAVVPFYSGVTYENLSLEFGRQWPCTKEKVGGTGTLFADGQQAKKFRFAPVAKKAVVTTDEQYPYALVFGNSNYYWNQNVLIQHSETLKREYRMLVLDYPAGFVEVNADDAKALGIRDGQKVQLKSAAGVAKVAAKVSGEVKKGTVFVPYFVHQVQQQLSGTSAGAKVLPVRVEKEAV
jgi:formate dehydrogenase major subunit